MSQAIKERVQEEMKKAMRAQDKERLGVIRLMLSEFKRIEVDERIPVLDEARELSILDKMLKQRRDAFQQFSAAGREDLASKEQYEMDVIQSFMPAGLSESEIDTFISSAVKEVNPSGPQDMGKVMALLKPKLQGRADIGQVSTKVKALLTK